MWTVRNAFSKLFVLLMKINTSVFFVVPNKCFVVDMALKKTVCHRNPAEKLEEEVALRVVSVLNGIDPSWQKTSLYRLDASKSNTTKNSVNYNYSRL